MKKIKENKNFTKKSPAQIAVFTIVIIIFIAYAISLIFPLLWLIMSSLKTAAEYSRNLSELEPFALPQKWMFSNYVDIFTKLQITVQGKQVNFFTMIFNSIWVILFTCIPNLFFSSIFAYVMAKYKFRFKEFIYGLYLFVLTLPIVGTGGAYYVLIKQLGLFNTPFYNLAVNCYCFTGHFLYMYACFKGISWEYAEAVFIDGGNHYTVFFKIMMPQAMPTIGTLFLTMAIAEWNVYTGVLMYLPSYPTVASGLYLATSDINKSGGITLYYTGLVVATLPLLILYGVFSDKLMKNLSMGGLKG